MIKSWQKALGIFTKNGKTLLIPLQEIINKSHQTLTSTINIQKNIVYIKHDQTWKIFKKNTASTLRNPTFQFYSNTRSQPNSTQPITVSVTDEHGHTIIPSTPAHNVICNDQNIERPTI